MNRFKLWSRILLALALVVLLCDAAPAAERITVRDSWIPSGLQAGWHWGIEKGIFAKHGIDARQAAMFDDLEKNLLVPHERGMTTVQVVAGDDFAHDQVDPWELDRTGGAHVHHVTADLAGFLRKLP